MQINSGDLVIIRHRTQVKEVHQGFPEKKGFTGKFVCFPIEGSIKLEMIGGWFPLDPEITKCELTFDLTNYDIEFVGKTNTV